MSKNRFSLCAVVVCLLALVSLSVSAKYHNFNGTSVPNSKDSSANNDSAQTHSDVPQELLFELRPSGFIPAETEITAGHYMLLLENRSGMKELNFTLERENQGRVAASDQHRRDWTKKVELAPGNYFLSETNHPEWRAVIRVTAR